MGSSGAEFTNGQNMEGKESVSEQVLGLVQIKTVGEVIPNTLTTESKLPKLFSSIKIRGLTFHNRIMVSPMCMYSCQDQDGVFSDFHLAHYGTLSLRGPALVMIEATAVAPNGRLSLLDTGLWNARQGQSLRRIVNLAHASGGKIGIQLAHGGRKGSTFPPYHNFEESQGRLGRGSVPAGAGGFPDQLVAPSPIPWKAEFSTPNEMSTAQVEEMVQTFAEAAQRAVDAGVDLVEIHAAHGYLVHSFLSGNTNKRHDKYGGSSENRLRFLLEIIQALRTVLPSNMPLFCRVSGTDYLGGEDILSADPAGWDIYQVIDLCRKAVPLGLDLIDISSGGNVSTVTKGVYAPEIGFQLPLAEQVKKAGVEGLVVGSVGSMHQGRYAEDALQDEKADVIFCAREFLKDPSLVFTMAEELGVKARRALQYSWMVPW